MRLFVLIDDSKFELELLETPTAKARQVVEPGTVCFWTEGEAIALPFGRTPISTDERPKLASRCNVLGRILGDARRLAAVKPGAAVRVEAA